MRCYVGQFRSVLPVYRQELCIPYDLDYFYLKAVYFL